MMNEDRDQRLILTRLISGLSPGPDLDKLLAMILFDVKSEPCDRGDGLYHMVGSEHYFSKIICVDLCSQPLPSFSTDWVQFKLVLEWVVAKFPGAEMVWDCDKWSCNISGVDGKGRWYRLTSSTGVAGFQEAVCKAALLAIVNPQALPLEFRSKVVDNPQVRRLTGGKRKRRRR